MEDEEKREKFEKEKSGEREEDDENEGKEGDDESEENENLRDLILEQLASLEQSDVYDDSNYKVRLSCILEDDESESSGAFKRGESNKESEKGPPEVNPVKDGPTGDAYDTETSYESGQETVRITDLDEGILPHEKTEEQIDGSEESDELSVEPDAYQIKKLKSSDDIYKKPFFVQKREASSDSSDLDVSMTNSTNGTGDKGTARVPGPDERDDETNASGESEETTVKGPAQSPDKDERFEETAESKMDTIEDDVAEPKTKNKIEVLDSETVSSIFAKVSRAYLEKTKGPVKWEENERIDRPITPLRTDTSSSRERFPSEDRVSIQDAHIRGTSPKEYNPPIPPETYLWEELKRLRERGGYPWTYLDKPPFDEASWKKYMEHVYEPINPPSSSSETNLPKEDFSGKSASSPNVPSIPDPVRQWSQNDSENQLINKNVEHIKDSEILDDKEGNKIRTKQETQMESKERLADVRTPLTMIEPTTSTNTFKTVRSEMAGLKDSTSKFFKDIPVKYATFEKMRGQQMRAQAQEIQEKFRNQAGKIRTRLNTMKEGSSLRRIKGPEGVGGIKLKLPEMHAPKIHLPRSKFKLPDKEIFHFPESARQHFADSSRFRLPERGKFNLAEKIHFPEKKKFHLPNKAKLHLPRPTKFNLPQKAKIRLHKRTKPNHSEAAGFQLPEKAKFRLPKRPKLNLPNKVNLIRQKVDILRSNGSKGIQDAQTSSIASTSEMDSKPYSKLFSQHSKDYTTSSPKQIRNRTPPPPTLESVRMLKAETKSNWLQNVDDDIQYADENDEEDLRDANYQKDYSLLNYAEKDFEFLKDYKSQSRRATMPERITDNITDYQKEKRKIGVLEEINSDEYFLRQKGISQDDIEVGNYLTREIREAFRSSGVNALAKMDYFDNQNLDPNNINEQPVRPARTFTVKKKKKESILKPYISDPYLNKESYKTYPPKRPERKSKSQSRSFLNKEPASTENTPQVTKKLVNSRLNDENETNLIWCDNTANDENEISEYYKSPGPPIEYEHYKVPKLQKIFSSLDPPMSSMKRKSSRDDEFGNKNFLGFSEAFGETETTTEPPVPMARKRNQKKKEKAKATTESPQPTEQLFHEIEKEYPHQDDVDRFLGSSVARERSQSLNSKKFTSEEMISCSFQSELELEHPENETVFEGVQQRLVENPQNEPDQPNHEPTIDRRREITDLDEVGFGYATVGKPIMTKPPRQKKRHKSEKAPFPRRKKEVSVPIYSIYSRTPVRPLRNYSTLKPSRPPRRKKLASINRSKNPQSFTTYSEIQENNISDSFDQIKVGGNFKNLQTEKVFEKMKGRPLPPPPRPLRQKSKGSDELSTKEAEATLFALKDEISVETQIPTFVHEPPCDSQIKEELSTSIQMMFSPSDSSQPDGEDARVIQEFSPEQLQIQREFLEKMKDEVAESKLREQDKFDLEDAELKAEVIRQIEDIIAEEKRILDEDKKKQMVTATQQTQASSSISELESVLTEGQIERVHSEPDIDMGYSSLERRGCRQEQSAPESPPQLPPKMAKLRVRELEAETITVNEVQANQIFVKEMQSNRMSSQEIDNTGGNVSLGTVNLSSSFIDQIVAKIPWENLRESQERIQGKTSRNIFPVRPQRRHRRGFQEIEDSEEDSYSHAARRTHRKHQRSQHVSDEDEEWERKMQTNKTSEPETSNSMSELSIQLARACTAAGLDTIKNFIQVNAAFARSLDKELIVQIALCIAVALVAAFFLFGYDAKIVHVNRWDFQFPPQPPSREI